MHREMLFKKGLLYSENNRNLLGFGKMKNIFFSFILFLFFVAGKSYGQEIYTTGIEVKQIDIKRISVSWRANTNEGSFVIYRNNVPISNVELVKTSKRIEISKVRGRRDKGSYVFPAYVDEVETGQFFYLVLPLKKDISKDDLLPLLNYTLSPVVILEEFMVINKLSIQTNIGSVFLSWSMASNCQADDLIFKIYRTTNFLTNEIELDNMQVYTVLTNEYYFEDFSIEAKVPYYYTITVGDFRILRAGKNQNIEPVIFGSIDTNIVVDTEIRERTNINYLQFINKFKREQ